MEDIQILNLVKKFLEQKQTLEKKIDDLSLNKEYAKLKKAQKQKYMIDELEALFNKYTKNTKEIEQLEKQLKIKNNNIEEKELYELEINSLIDDNADLLNEMKPKLITNSQNTSKKVILEIRGATGGDEANIFAADLLKMYRKYCENNNLELEVVEIIGSEKYSLTKVVCSVKGNLVFEKLKFESGIHRVQRIPETETKGRIHTSTASVVVLPTKTDVEININPSDLKIDTFRASGAGGQHINKTNSAIRITHIPNNIVVVSQEGRSQHDNKSYAMDILKARLHDYYKNIEDNKISSIRSEAIGGGSRSEKIRTYNFPQNRVTDHRVGKSWNSLSTVIQGKIEDIIHVLTNHFNELELKKIIDEIQE